MEVSKEKLMQYTRRIMLSRMRLLCNNGFYGLLLMYMHMSISTEHETAWSDGNEYIYFNPDFLEQISDSELDYALMHVLMHIVLRHLERKGDFEDKYYDQAADIIVNSNVLRSNGGNSMSISLKNFGGVQPSMVPGGDEGWKYSVEEVYGMLRAVARPEESDESDEEEDEEQSDGGGDSDDDTEDSSKSDENAGADGDSDNGEEDSSNSDEDSDSEMGLDDSDDSGDSKSGRGKQSGADTSASGQDSADNSSGWDYHNKPAEINEKQAELNANEWKSRVMQAAEAMNRRNSALEPGSIPAFAERYIENLKKPQTDWRTVLDEFIQEEINDYSFCPPDRRFNDSPFFLPDFNEKDFRIEKILFMIDTSGSMSDDQITECYSEIKGAIDQFDGKLEGWLGFFDAVVVPPEPFVDESDFLAIRPKGGGGTRFDIIFNYVRDKMGDDPPVSIVILTDGYAPFPDETTTMGIPVLWIINNEDVEPPFGKVARIKSEEADVFDNL